MKIYIQNKVAFWICFLLLGFALQSCEEFVHVDLPSNQLTGPIVFEDEATADAALIHIYTKLRSEQLVTGTSDGLSCLLGNYADELDYYGIGGLPAFEFYQNNLLPSNSTVTLTWNATYNLIYATNSIIEGVSNSTGISLSSKERLLGEAYFIRAYLHFYLVNLFGEIPYVVTTDYQVNSVVEKISTMDVYAALTTDLQQAVTLLPESYFVPERIRPNRSVAYALLSRIKLYSENWSQAVLYADEVLNNTSLYTIEADLNAVFLKNSTGTLWQLLPQFSGANTLEAQTFILSSGPPPSFALTSSLLASFETGDLRRSNWIGTVTDGVDSWYYANKYKEQGNTGSSVEYSILFRIEEFYLIRAEAKAQLGDLIGAQEDLNVIRNRAGLPDTTAITQTTLLNAILEERGREFFTELGHRWFDLKRTGNASTILSVIKPGWDSKDLLWPLPESELLLNSNLLPQNPGY